MSKQPKPPENVRLVSPDGQTVIPVELTYEGEQDGMYVWIAVDTSAHIKPGWHVQCDMLPAKTAIGIELDREEWIMLMRIVGRILATPIIIFLWAAGRWDDWQINADDYGIGTDD
jgi:hypothetical protein